jgi:putative peptide zinc metalloprotease protein
VADLRPRLRSTVRTHRQHFRGQTWHVVQDPANNQFFRLGESGYHFVGLLDGRRTVAEAWRITNEELGDLAPTQGEAIQLLGQLYASNLLQAELPPDAEGLFRRYRQRVRREIQSYLMNLLFIRIPILDPDRFLDAFVGVFGLAFTWIGAVLWAALVGMGLYFVGGRLGELARSASRVLDPQNWLFLYASVILVKVLHEFSHAFACKKFGRQTGSGGEVHVMGVMFLVFMPLPYVDASSAWAFRSKWHRMIVGAAGMLVELPIAGVAAAVWANTAEGATAHAVAYNILFIASVSTLLFNGNPLLRYDGYYMLSDLLEIPNLSQRSRDYVYYLVRRYLWSVRQVRNPAGTPGEQAWLLGYGIASTIYRVFICVAILLFVADKLFMVGAALAVAAAIAWVAVPLGKFLHYLVTSGELMRTRGRAVATVLAALLAVLVGAGLIPAPDRARVPGVVEPVRLAVIHAGADGFITDCLASGTSAGPDGPVLLRQENPELSAQHQSLLAERRKVESQRRLARSKDDRAAEGVLTEKLATIAAQVRRVEEQLAAMEVRAPFAGTWVGWEIEQQKGQYVHRGDRLGLVASPEELLIRAVAGNTVAAALKIQADPEVDIRLQDRPDLHLSGRIQQILPAGQDQLPSAALGYRAGGSVETAADDRQGLRTAEPFFEIRIRPEAGDSLPLMSGQRVQVRFHLKNKPLAAQWYRSLLQLIQRRFHV